jgi:hypothetical protein
VLITARLDLLKLDYCILINLAAAYIHLLSKNLHLLE